MKRSLVMQVKNEIPLYAPRRAKMKKISIPNTVTNKSSRKSDYILYVQFKSTKDHVIQKKSDFFVILGFSKHPKQP